MKGERNVKTDKEIVAEIKAIVKASENVLGDFNKWEKELAKSTAYDHIKKILDEA